MLSPTRTWIPHIKTRIQHRWFPDVLDADASNRDCSENTVSMFSHNHKQIIKHVDGPGSRKWLFSTFLKRSGDRFLIPNRYRLSLRWWSHILFEVTFLWFFLGPQMAQHGQTWSNIDKKHILKKCIFLFKLVGGMGPWSGIGQEVIWRPANIMSSFCHTLLISCGGVHTGE